MQGLVAKLRKMAKKEGKSKMTGGRETYMSTCLQPCPACLRHPEKMGEEPGCGLRKGVISPLVTETVGIYCSKTEVLSV